MSNPMVYGYVNGKEVYSRDEFIFTKRRFGKLESDEDLMEYAGKVTYNWSKSGHSFKDFYLGNYCLDEPMASLTMEEYSRLRELQKIAIKQYEDAEKAREWKYESTTYWADNSVEETWVDKNGVKKTVMVTGPHGDACY